MAACWLNQDHPRNKTRPWCAMASRGSKNKPKIVLHSTATKIVTKLMNWNQYRVGTRLQRVHTDCLGRKFSPQRSQYTVTLPVAGIQASDRRQLTAFAVPKTTGQRGSFGLGRFSCTKVWIVTRGFGVHNRQAQRYVFVSLSAFRSAFSGTRPETLPLCGLHPAARPVAFPDRLFASPNLSTGHSCR